MRLFSYRSNIGEKMFDISVTVPKIFLGYYKDEDIDLREFGFKLSDLDTGITFSRYDYGTTFDISIAGFGISLWFL